MFRSFVASCCLWCRSFDFFSLSSTWASTANDETGETDPGDSRIRHGHYVYTRLECGVVKGKKMSDGVPDQHGCGKC
jgi:hypothetical protein